jgi:hypothetical protein
MKKEEIDQTLMQIEMLATKLWQQKDIYDEIPKMNYILGKIYKELINKVKQYGITEIKIDDLVQQLRDLKQGMENEDTVLLADTFNYKIYRTVELYKQIIDIEEEESGNI